VLDIGCGEGWLVRALAELGIHAIGADVVPELVEHARQAGGGDFHVASYEDIAAGDLDVTVDAAVANFSLIGRETVESLLAQLHGLVNTGGSLVIQTLHPVAANAAAGLPYVDGWRPGSWTGFSSEFTDPAPWYFRTLEGWVHLLERCKWRLHELREPLHPETKQPASVIFIARAAG
jgi:2-polyprenyl-3-methyl-5-hydroxy-6-metoxy-1,4-benzoquinol methylase